MNRNLEYISYSDNDRLAMLENRAAELERRLAQATPAVGLPEFQVSDHGPAAFAAYAPPSDFEGYADSGRDDLDRHVTCLPPDGNPMLITCPVPVSLAEKCTACGKRRGSTQTSGECRPAIR